MAAATIDKFSTFIRDFASGRFRAFDYVDQLLVDRTPDRSFWQSVNLGIAYGSRDRLDALAQAYHYLVQQFDQRMAHRWHADAYTERYREALYTIVRSAAEPLGLPWSVVRLTIENYRGSVKHRMDAPDTETHNAVNFVLARGRRLAEEAYQSQLSTSNWAKRRLGNLAAPNVVILEGRMTSRDRNIQNIPKRKPTPSGLDAQFRSEYWTMPV
jgi:hypothetical protein